MSPASCNTAASGTPVHSLALRIIPSWVREGLGPSPLKYSKKVASLPEHSMTVRTLRPGKRRNWSKLRVSGALDLTDNLQLPLSALHNWRHGEVLDGIVQMGGRDEPLQVHNRRPDPHRAAFIVGQRDRVDVFGRPAVPVASLFGVGRIRTDGLVHPQKIRDWTFLFRHCHAAPSCQLFVRYGAKYSLSYLIRLAAIPAASTTASVPALP